MKVVNLNKVLFEDAVKQASEIISNNGIIIIPTDTIYGISGDVFSNIAYEKIYGIKNRDFTKIISWQIKQYNDIFKFINWGKIPSEINLSTLFNTLFPGPFTLIIPVISTHLPSHLQHLTSIGIRIPDHPFTLALSAELSGPVSTTSANISGEAYTHDIDYIINIFEGKVDAVFYEKSKAVPLASTIIELHSKGITLIREGAVSWETVLNLYNSCIKTH